MNAFPVWRIKNRASFIVCVMLAIGQCADADAIKLFGNVKREMLGQQGNVLFFERSTAVLGIETNKEAEVQRYIRWQNTSGMSQQYWISTNKQFGLVVNPLVSIQQDTNVPQSSANYALATNAIIAWDIQPRGASPEVAVLTFFSFTSDLLDEVVKKGLVPLWGSYDSPELVPARVSAVFEKQFPGLLFEANFVWDEALWNKSKSNICSNIKVNEAITNSPYPDNFLIAKLTVENLDETNGVIFPKNWKCCLYSPGSDGKPYMLGLIEWTTTNVAWANELGPFPTSVPPRVAVADYRPSSAIMPGLSIQYSSESNFFPLSVKSALYTNLERDAIYLHDNRLRTHFGFPEVDRDGKPIKKGAYTKLVVRCILLVLLILPLVFFAGYYFSVNKNKK